MKRYTAIHITCNILIWLLLIVLHIIDNTSVGIIGDASEESSQFVSLEVPTLLKTTLVMIGTVHIFYIINLTFWQSKIAKEDIKNN